MKIIAANWKMNHSFDKSDEWLDAFMKGFSDNYDQLKKVEIVLCPPLILSDHIDSELMHDAFEFLEEVMKKDGKKFEDYSAEELDEIIIGNRPIKLGAQDCHYEDSGSFTGDIAASMLKEVGCEYVILGHSERRVGHFESSEIVRKKVKAAIAGTRTPIICVGESKEIRDKKLHMEFVHKQILESVPGDVKFGKLVIAYEPIWSIGTGVTPTLDQISEVAQLVKKIFSENFVGRADQYFLLYGGSVNSENSGQILRISNVDGLLVGKASLDANEFMKICVS